MAGSFTTKRLNPIELLNFPGLYIRHLKAPGPVDGR